MGPWWMTVTKLEAVVQALAQELAASGVAHPGLIDAPALTGAEAALARAADSLRRVHAPRTEPADDLLRMASAAVVRADEAVQRARALAAMATRARECRSLRALALDESPAPGEPRPRESGPGRETRLDRRLFNT